MHKAAIMSMATCLTVLAAAPAALSPLLGSPFQPGGPPAAGPLTAGQITVRPDVIRLPVAPASQPPSTRQCQQAAGIACYGPGQLRSAYQLLPLYARGVTGKGVTIMIVDPFGSPTIKADLAVFDRHFGYPAPPKFSVIAPVGKIPAYNPVSGDMQAWAGETTLDVEYAHALAPGASILLVQTPVSETEGVAGFPQIVRAEQYALAHDKVGVISQSFSATEQTFKDYGQLALLRAAYADAQRRQVTVLAASGDSGATDYLGNQQSYYARRVTSWPDSDPLVTAVGGTQLRPGHSPAAWAAWNDTYNREWNRFASSSTTPGPAAGGGGRSEFFTRPHYQDSVKAVTGDWRGVPDIAMSAACDGSVEVYSSYPPGPAGWSLTCGTSEATPEFAAIVALADQVAGHPLGLINPVLYRLKAAGAPGIVSVTSGDNTVSFASAARRQLVTVRGYDAASGYNLATGVGTVDALRFVYELAAPLSQRYRLIRSARPAG
jgi:subtilase family serine protease